MRCPTLRRRFLPLLGLPVALALAGCGKEPPPKVEPPRPVRSIVVTPSPVATVLTLPAEIRPRIEARYGFRVGGKIAQRMVSVGDRVVPGQVLARLDPQDLAPAVAAARAALEAARTDERLAATELARLKDLRDKNFISAGQLDRQQAAFDAAASRTLSAQAQLNQATNSVEFQTLKADVAGRVMAIEAEAGQVVAAGQVVVRVAKDAEVEALVNVPEADVAQARAASEWLVTVPALDGRTLKGRIRELSPVADAASRTYPMRLTLSGQLTDLHWGMTAVASLARESAMGLFVPLTALYSKDGQPYLWLVDPQSQTVRLQPIRTGGFVDERVRVVDGLKAGDRVVTAGANLLIDGQRIKLADAAR
ncbi:MAG TPA: efflux RND transporter periplasmic adaptor subunit [Burkholderiaceae bacterium]|nr:efflux RND transporter periplasmic adaptor subunit [Burkholderiaceae bacterium]